MKKYTTDPDDKHITTMPARKRIVEIASQLGQSVIVKIQRALTDPPSILVYDKPRRQGRSDIHEIFAQLPMSYGDIAAILGDDLKGYFEAKLLPSSTIEIGARVTDEDW